MRLARKKNQICTVYGRPRREKQGSGKWGPLKLPIGGTSPFAMSRLSGRPIVSNRRHPATSILLFRKLRVAYKIDTNWKVEATNTIETNKAAA